MYRPSQNIVIARDLSPAQFRPSNQARLVPSHAANPSPSDPASMLPGMGEVRHANGISSNGLAGGAADRRFAYALAGVRHRAMMIQAAGRAGAPSRPIITTSFAQALAALPGAPGQSLLRVDLAWTGRSVAAERAKVLSMYGLRPIKAWGSVQAFVTEAFGQDETSLREALAKQPGLKVVRVSVYVPETSPAPVAAAPSWSVVEEHERKGGYKWVISKQPTAAGGQRFAVTLYRGRGSAVDEVVRSDDIATLDSAREYIRAYEVRRGDFATNGKAGAWPFWQNSLRKSRTSAANSAPAASRASMNGFAVINAPAPQAPDADEPRGYTNVTAHEAKMLALDGLGRLGELAMGPLGIAAIAIGGFIFLSKNR